MEDFPNILENPTVTTLAEKYKKSSGQILLRHLIQRDIVVIPKSTNPLRIAQNIDVFDFVLDEIDMGQINNLDKGECGRIFDFLFFKGVENHNEYPFPLKVNERK